MGNTSSSGLQQTPLCIALIGEIPAVCCGNLLEKSSCYGENCIKLFSQKTSHISSSLVICRLSVVGIWEKDDHVIGRSPLQFAHLTSIMGQRWCYCGTPSSQIGPLCQLMSTPVTCSDIWADLHSPNIKCWPVWDNWSKYNEEKSPWYPFPYHWPL